MSCSQNGPTECDTIQIIEPRGDFIVDTAGTTSDLDERGSVELFEGDTQSDVTFRVAKLNTSYNFEYLYVDAIGDVHPGAVVVVPTQKSAQGFRVLFAGSPIGEGYVLHWRVTIVRTSDISHIDLPEDLYLQMPQTPAMRVTFSNPRSNSAYGFSELRVENLTDDFENQTIISIQVGEKDESGFSIGVNPTPPTDNYFLKVRTP